MSSRSIRWSFGVLLILGSACREGEPDPACPEGPVVVLDSAACGERVLEVPGNVFAVADSDDLATLSGVTFLKASLEIAHTTLTSLAGLESLRCVQWSVTIADNSALTDLDGLIGLARIGQDLLLGDLKIGGNGELGDIVGLANLEQVGGRLQVERNPKLQDLSPLAGLVSIGDQLQVFDNASLASVAGLSALQVVGRSLNVAKNPGLPTCEIHKLRDQLDSNRCRLVCIQENGKDSCEDDAGGCWYPWKP